MTTKRKIVLAVLVIVLILVALDIYFGSAPGWPFCNARVVAEEVADFTAADFLPAQTVAAIARDNALKLFPNRT